MNRPKLFSLVLGLALPVATTPFAQAASHQPGSSKLTVNYPNWQNYTDVKDSYNPTDRGEMGILDQFRRDLEAVATYNVPDGDHLTLTFSDIDLAGDFEPWHGANWSDVRIVKDLYPPRFKFSYQLTGPKGELLKQGNENLTDLNFTMRATLDRSDPLRYEKQMMQDWMGSRISR